MYSINGLVVENKNMNKADLIKTIDEKIGNTSRSIWTVGITDEPETRKAQHQNEGKSVKYWTHWPTDSESEAREVEQHFLEKGMRGGAGGGGKAAYVYVF